MSAQELAAILGDDAVSTEHSDLLLHEADHSASALLRTRAGRARGAALCVAHPRTTEEVSTLLAWADSTGTAVVPYGGGSGVSRAIEAEGAVVIDTTRLDAIVDIDDKSLLVRVQAGVVGSVLDRALRREGLRVGNEPQSIAISTVGGWIATRACGQLSAGYGAIEDLVRGLEAVLPSGEIVRSKAVPRRSAGPDVASLMIGSEGTLGVVTEATLRVFPAPGDRCDLALSFDEMADGVAACRALARSDLRPAVVRLYDREDASIFFRSLESPPAGPVLLLSFEGRDARERGSEAAELSQGAEADGSLVAHWWEHRNDAADEYRRIMAGHGLLGPHGVVDTIEVSSTWSKLRKLYHSMKDNLTVEAGIVGCHLSHVYPDGACLYFTLASICDDDREALQRLERWWDVGMRTCLDAGGSISHHHGIGRLKARWLPEELGGWWQVLRAVKGTIDPRGIMNPGALGL